MWEQQPASLSCFSPQHPDLIFILHSFFLQQQLLRTDVFPSFLLHMVGSSGLASLSPHRTASSSPFIPSPPPASPGALRASAPFTVPGKPSWIIVQVACSARGISCQLLRLPASPAALRPLLDLEWNSHACSHLNSFLTKISTDSQGDGLIGIIKVFWTFSTLENLAWAWTVLPSQSFPKFWSFSPVEWTPGDVRLSSDFIVGMYVCIVCMYCTAPYDPPAHQFLHSENQTFQVTPLWVLILTRTWESSYLLTPSRT